MVLATTGGGMTDEPTPVEYYSCEAAALISALDELHPCNAGDVCTVVDAIETLIEALIEARRYDAEPPP